MTRAGCWLDDRISIEKIGRGGIKRKVPTFDLEMRIFEWAVLDLNQQPPACRKGTLNKHIGLI